MSLDPAEFREYLQIDKNLLDDEVCNQPKLFEKVAEAATMALAERDALKEKLAEVDAGLSKHYRKALAKGGGRVTDAQVQTEVQLDDDHKAAFGAYLEAKRTADILLGLKEAFKDRSFMLRELASLYVSRYYDDTSTRGDARTDKMSYDKQRERLAEARSKRTR